MSTDVMNDTFDNFTLSDIRNEFLAADFSSPFNETKCFKNINDVRKSTPASDIKNNSKNEISFDDSLFLSGIQFSQDLAIQAEEKVTSFTDIVPGEQLILQEESIHANESTDIFETSEPDKQCDNTNQIEKMQHLKDIKRDPTSSTNSLSQWGLPSSVLEKYKSKKITTMFQWQVECLNNPKILKSNANLVYSAPTSAGKTLVSEILTVKTIFEREKKVIFILPYVSVVREKMFYFQEIFSTSGVRVEGFMGSYNPPGGFQSVQLAICTIEKANSLINKLLLENNLADIGAVVIDEMHLLGDPSRGYLLELLLTKLRYVSLRDENVKIQIIGMSATLPNLEVLAKWLDAELYVTNYRPIPLYEQAHVCGEIYDHNLKLIRKLNPLQELDTDTDNILQLCLETIGESCSVLIFCPTKNWCENLAQQISSAFWKLGNAKTDLSQKLRQQLKPDLISELLQQLQYCPVGLDEILRKTVSFGVAFHHAGLTMDERDIIESAFRNGAIRVLIATSTLSSGVNLPARRVIIRTPTFHGKPIDTLTYRQMIGRAGRMGKDTAGESILVCQKNDYKTAKFLMSAHLEPIESCLEGDGKLKRAILEVVASGVASTPDDVKLFTTCTLLAQNESFDDPIVVALEFLIKNEFIRLHQQDGVSKYAATGLGKACLSASIPPEEGLSLFTELEKARQCFVLETELHLIYLVTPYTACHQWGNIDWMFYLNLWEKLSASMKRVGELVGVRESYIVSATRGKLQTNTTKLYHKLLVHKRFFVALALQDLVNEIPLSDVSDKFNCNRGMLQSLQLTASTFAGMITAFSRQLGWSTVEILISQFQDRLHFGVSRDLLDLMRLSILNGKCARALFNAGIESLVQLANSDVTTIEHILHKVVPFESGRIREGESEFDVKERSKFRNIWITGKEGLTESEAAALLLANARSYLQIEMGLKEARWEKSDQQEQKSEEEITAPSKNVNTSNFSDQSLFNSSYSNDRGVNADSGCKINSDQSLFEDSFPLAKLDYESSPKDAFISNYSRSKNTSTGSLNSSTDLITNSQDETYLSLNDITKHLSIRKRLRSDKENDLWLVSQQSPRKKKKFAKTRSTMKISQDNNNQDSDLDKFQIVHVCSHDELYKNFCTEIMSHKSISFSVACTKVDTGRLITIGLNQNCREMNSENFVYKNRKVVGFAITWGSNVVYYLNLEKMENCVGFIREIAADKSFVFKMFDSKEQIKVLKRCCDVFFDANVEDPKIADWLMQPEGKEKNLSAMVISYCSEVSPLIQLCGSSKGVGSISLDLHSTTEPKLRACVESLVTWYLADSLKDSLKQQNRNLSNVYEIEMACLKVLSRTEVNGVGVTKASLNDLVSTLNEQLAAVEKRAYSLAGRQFSFTSSKDVAKVLGIFKGRKVSTKKEILEKSENPISDLVLQWRKISGIITKMILPLVRAVDEDRIYGCCIMHTATGRISMHEPNLQNIAKKFEIVHPLHGEKISISCRDAFVAKHGCVLVSADYCQLELRLLAHLSKDLLLCKTMKAKGDVFRSIAGKWNNIPENEVTDSLRQNAKQICYGIIYGMGSKALSEQLCIDEKDAASFMESFKNTYPGVKNYIKNVIEMCRKCGHVETIAGRRRYLAHINDKNAATRSQAERQAVNTTIQGSAADVVKKTMIDVEESLNVFSKKPTLVLHLHDELIYEVPHCYFNKFVNLLKTVMEGSVKLSIPFPVKVKHGPSWGQLTDYNL